ncbi:hypothetical protein [Lacibacter sp.]|uniref:hypothetical protein n=1 Tax=Lacibacter sp. TaxID=1915409 RepID=UPI002B4B7802|nr:hypothetical protein [Lacibacter sp.]HLP36084.1 hypothetical protein [Lacibacter sp.]
MRKHNRVRDLLVYTITSVQKLLLKGMISLFLKDIRVFGRWWKFRVSSKSTLDFRTPWLVFDAIDFLSNWLRKDMVVFEYGSGGSSLFISDRVNKLYSVEHNEQWFGNVSDAIKTEGIQNIDLRLYRPVVKINDPKVDCSDPKNYISCMGEFKDLNFETYVKSIAAFPDNYFDLIIVDGRARPSCIQHAMPKVKTGGVLLVDNADRAYYLSHFPELRDEDNWDEKAFIGHFPYCPASILGTTILFTKKGY